MVSKKKDGNAKLKMKRNAKSAQEYRELLKRVGWTQMEACAHLHFSDRTSRRVARGDVKLPGAAIIVLRLLASGVINKRQIVSAWSKN